MRTRTFPLAFAVCCAAPAAAQDSKPPPLTDAQWQEKFEALVRETKDEIDDLKFQVGSLEQDAAATRARFQAPQAQSASVFNPAVTVFGNFLARSDDRHVFVDDDPTLERVDDRMLLREVEIDMRAAIDPWSDGVLILAFAQEVPGEYEAAVEEGYFTLKKLPFTNTAPLGLKVKAGRFRPEFGRFNITHLHDLPQPSFPRALGNVLGPEGLVQDGLSAQFFLPAPGERHTIEATVQVLNGDQAPIAPDASGSDLALLEHVKWFHDLTDQQSLELGGSSWISNSDHRLYGLDATYKWKPFLAGDSRSFLIGGELFAADLDDPAVSDHPHGWYAWTQYQFSRNTYFGLRFDQARELSDDDLVTNTIGAYLTYYTTEFLRFRLGAEHAESDVDTLDGRDTLLLELNFVYGSHPVEPYWVNR